MFTNPYRFENSIYLFYHFLLTLPDLRASGVEGVLHPPLLEKNVRHIQIFAEHALFFV